MRRKGCPTRGALVCEMNQFVAFSDERFHSFELWISCWKVIDNPVYNVQEGAVEFVLHFISFEMKRTRSLGFCFQLLQLGLGSAASFSCKSHLNASFGHIWCPKAAKISLGIRQQMARWSWSSRTSRISLLEGFSDRSGNALSFSIKHHSK